MASCCQAGRAFPTMAFLFPSGFALEVKLKKSRRNSFGLFAVDKSFPIAPLCTCVSQKRKLLAAWKASLLVLKVILPWPVTRWMTEATITFPKPIPLNACKRHKGLLIPVTTPSPCSPSTLVRQASPFPPILLSRAFNRHWMANGYALMDPILSAR